MTTTQIKKRDKQLKNVKQSFKLLYYIVCIICLLWCVTSYFEIVSQNIDMVNPTVLSKWNLFEIIFSGHY